jgi:hypothetical protein
MRPAQATDDVVRMPTEVRAKTTAALVRLQGLAAPSVLQADQLAIAEQLFSSFYLRQIEASEEFGEAAPWVAWVVAKKGPDNGLFSDWLMKALAQGSKTATHFSMASDAIRGLADIQWAGFGKNLIVIDGLSALLGANDLDINGFQRGVGNLVGLLINQKTAEGKKIPNISLILVDDADLLQKIDVPLYQRINAVIDGFPPCAKRLGRITLQ